MAKKNSTSNISVFQLPLPELNRLVSKSIAAASIPAPQRDNRPLPLLIAGKYGFALQHHDIEDNPATIQYAVQDWFAGLLAMDTKAAARRWKEWKQNDTLERGTLYSPLNYRASDGKNYQRDFTNAAGLYAIAQKLYHTNPTPLVIEICEFLRTSGIELDMARINPDAASALIHGMEDFHQIGRQSGKEAHGVFTAAAKTTHVTHTPNYGKLTNIEYENLLGQSKATMVNVLKLTDSQASHLRDHVSTLALKAMETAEIIIAHKMLALKRPLTNGEQEGIVRSNAKSVGEMFLKLSQDAQIDLLTGRDKSPQLNARNNYFTEEENE